MRQHDRTRTRPHGGFERLTLDVVRGDVHVNKNGDKPIKKQRVDRCGESGGDRNIIMEIRAGTGGLEASLFVADLYRMYTKYAAGDGFKADVMNTSPTQAG